MIRATCGTVDPIFNCYPSALGAVKAFLAAFTRPWGVQKSRLPAGELFVIMFDCVLMLF